ncbi:hypothetical protein [Roseovarius aestuariivivens]|uniref:hypothetical protein n=1 Tax=Roseovarius aestuariivivens TaxID=1888910 RepID=UPI001080452F|nr:hypothetical protein [Roseovarius aestuariivivens]
MTAALAGAASGFAITLTMYLCGLLRDRSGLAVLVAAIAFFYPVFAVDHGGLFLHGAIFATFAAAAIWAYHRSTLALALVLGAHGLLDLALGLTGHPGPGWWPHFCGALDLAAAALVCLLVRLERIPA